MMSHDSTGEPVCDVTKAEFLPTGSVFERLENDNTYTLVADGTPIATIVTDFRDETLKASATDGYVLRSTLVNFFEPGRLSWHTSVEIPAEGPFRQEFEAELRGKKLGLVAGVPQRRVEHRRIAIREGSVSGSQAARGVSAIAETRGTIDRSRRNGGVTVVTAGREYRLTPAREARRGRIEEYATIRRRTPLPSGLWSSGWIVESSRPVPLAAVLLHWHLLMGDFHRLGTSAQAG